MTRRSHSIADELRAAGDRQALMEFESKYAELLAQYSPTGKDPRALKQGYAVELSKRLAVTVANALRPEFRGILPERIGAGGESLTAVGKGSVRLDVNYSTARQGLALGISIKTMNFKDTQSGRYTKNIQRIDKELRTEADQIHTRQPYAVLTALVFFPNEVCSDAKQPGGRTSFFNNYHILQGRVRRNSHAESNALFEGLWVGLYEHRAGSNFGSVEYVDVDPSVPPQNAPAHTVSFDDVISAIKKLYKLRNPF
jgi:hypothetical protein